MNRLYYGDNLDVLHGESDHAGKQGELYRD